MDIYLAYEEIVVRVVFWGDEIESIATFYPTDYVTLGQHDAFKIFPANIFVTSPQRMASGLAQIELDLGQQVEFFQREDRELEARFLSCGSSGSGRCLLAFPLQWSFFLLA